MGHLFRLAAVVLVLSLPQICLGQAITPNTPASAAAGTQTAPPAALGPDYYFNSTAAAQQAIWQLPAPPAVDSTTQATNAQTLNTVIATASPTMVANAQATANYSVFDFSAVLGPGFNAQNLPILNNFFNQVTTNTVDASQDVKAYFNSPGPQMPATYPSTQTMMGIDEGVLLGDMVPEKATQLNAFGIQEGLNRLIVDAHWPTDVTGGQMLANILLPDMFASPQFQSDFNAAKTEVRTKLGLN